MKLIINATFSAASPTFVSPSFPYATTINEADSGALSQVVSATDSDTGETLTITIDDTTNFQVSIIQKKNFQFLNNQH